MLKIGSVRGGTMLDITEWDTPGVRGSGRGGSREKLGLCRNIYSVLYKFLHLLYVSMTELEL